MVSVSSSSERKLRHLRHDIREEDTTLVKHPLPTSELTSADRISA